MGPSILAVVSLAIATALLLRPSAACVSAERQALLAFKLGIKADPQGVLSRWTADGDCCAWGGTVCDSTGHVTSLELSPDPAFDDDTYYLKGTIAAALAKLTYLERLDLASLKQLSGSLPAGLGGLQHLQYLSVRRSQLTGPIPSSLGRLTSLTWLELGENKFSGAIPSTLGNIGHQLQYMYLGNNRLSGAIPPSLYNLTGLQSFYINDNALTGSVSPLVSRLQALTNLAVDTNKLTGALPREMGSLARLGYLDMSGNGFTGPIPTSWEALENLYHLWLQGNKLTGAIPARFASNLKKLITLDLSDNQLRGPIPQGAPFSDFPAAAFAGNAGLCNHPLPPCKR